MHNTTVENQDGVNICELVDTYAMALLPNQTCG